MRTGIGDHDQEWPLAGFARLTGLNFPSRPFAQILPLNKMPSAPELPDYDDEITEEQIAYIRKVAGPLPEGPVVVLTSLLVDSDTGPGDRGETTAVDSAGD